VDEGIKPRTPRKYSATFEECCPFYLSIGMTYEQYWDGDNDLPKYYRKAERMRQEQKNHEAWLNGLYVYDALASVMSHMNKNKSDHKSYAEKPYDFTPSKKTQEEKRLEAEAQAEVWLKSWVSATQKAFKDK
jgi:hypothetical protein